MTRPDALPPDHSRARAGLLYGLAAHATWGLFPLYLHQVTRVPPTVILAHRIVWSVLFLVLLVSISRTWEPVRIVARERRAWPWLAGSTVCIGINWLVFIYAVSTKQVLQSSMGYFMNPLVVVTLGMVFLGERLRPLQWVAIALAVVGVVWLAKAQGGLPWIALSLGISFAFYGLLRKQAPVGAIPGLLFETLLLLPPAAVWTFAYHSGATDYAPINAPGMIALLSLLGIFTSVPLIWFAVAARRLPMVTLGFLQYLTPTLQFLVAVLAFGEPLQGRLQAFGFVWAAVLIFVADSAWRARAARPVTSA